MSRLQTSFATNHKLMAELDNLEQGQANPILPDDALVESLRANAEAERQSIRNRFAMHVLARVLIYLSLPLAILVTLGAMTNKLEMMQDLLITATITYITCFILATLAKCTSVCALQFNKNIH